MNPSILEQSIHQYQELAQLGASIEQAVYAGEIASVRSLCEVMIALQEQIQANEGDLHASLRQHRNDVPRQISELLSLMQQIQERNQRLIPHINGIKALQRNELKQLKIGLETARGYASHHARRTGSIINSSN